MKRMTNAFLAIFFGVSMVLGGCMADGGTEPDVTENTDDISFEFPDFPDLDLPSGSSSSCSTSVSVNGQSQAIDCVSQNGGPFECICEINGNVVDECETDSNRACSIPGGNCCGF